MISVEEAKAIIEAEVNPGKIMIESVTEAYGLTLYADVIARNDIPNFAQSSMDGYAIKFDDRQGQLSVIGEMPAGATIQLKILAGEATRIFTGAPLPEGADTVVMQEKVAIDGKSLLIKDESIQRGQNVRLKGAEIKNGDTAMKAGTNLSTAALGFLSGIGCAHVAVFYPPRVAIVLTGNELQEPGRELQFGQVYEANSVQLSAALKNTGIREIKIYRAEDDPEKLA
ncbi:MAG: molybdopterin molybdenumtransferase MoeA, partial [Flavobacterium sp.]